MEVTEQLELSLSDSSYENHPSSDFSSTFNHRQEEITLDSQSDNTDSTPNLVREEAPQVKKESTHQRFSFRALAQINLTYIIAEDDEGDFILSISMPPTSALIMKLSVTK